MSFLLTLFFSLYTNAIEPINPLQHCDRFVQPNQKTLCEEKVNKLKPDWYLANVCDRFFEDDEFYECLQLSEVAHFDPIKISLCDDEEKDSSRMSCVKRNAQFGKANTDFQNFTVQRPGRINTIDTLDTKELRKPAFKGDR